MIIKKMLFFPSFHFDQEICTLNSIHKFWFPSEGPNLEGKLNITKITQYEIVQVLQDHPKFILTSRKMKKKTTYRKF